MTERRMISSAAVLLAVVIFVAVLPGVPLGNAAASSNLSVAISGNVLVASRNNTLAIAISNVGKYMTDLDVALTLPPTLALFGDNHWIRPTFMHGEVISANLTIFAPSSAAGMTLQGSMVAVYKLIGETTPSSETHMLSFLVLSQNPMRFVVALAGQGLTAGFKNNVTITATNSYSSGSVYPSTAVHDVDLAVSIPPPLQMFGDNHWHYDSVTLGQSVTVSFQIYAPAATIGNSFQGSITLRYRWLGDISYAQETHPVTLSVRGWIDIKVYEVTVSPDPAPPGTEITISGYLLNRGVIPAMYTNVSLAGDPPLLKDSIKPTYVGQVDSNAPAPFSVTATIDPSTRPGDYQARILVYYRDDLQVDLNMRIPTSFSVIAELPKTQTTQTGITELLSSQMLPLEIVGGILLVVVIVVVIRKLRRHPEASVDSK